MLFLLGALPAGTAAISDFGLRRDVGGELAGIDFDDIWFYDEDRSKQIPDINLEWVAVALNAGALDAAPLAFESDAESKDRVLKRAKETVGAYDAIVDVLYDLNLAEDGCFFRLRDGLSETEVKELIRGLDQEEWVAYTHPTLIVQAKTVAYFNAFRMEWKTGVQDSSKQDLMAQAHVFFEPAKDIYRVNVPAMPFFKAINLLAEDIRVMNVVPYWVPLEPSIRVDLSVPLQGAQIGDRIPFSFRIEFSDRIRIDPSSLVNINLRPGHIQKELFELKFDPYDYVKAASQSPLTLTGWMKIYSPGEFVIPAVEIHYECTTCSGDPVRSIKTGEIPLKIGSLVPSKRGKAKLAVPVDNVNPVLPTESLRDQARKALWQAVGSFVIAAALLGWLGRKWVAGKRERRGVLEEKREDVLAERLRAYLTQVPSSPHWEVAGQAGRQLREYVVTKYGLDRNPRQGSGEVFFEAVQGRIPGGLASPLRSLLREIDGMIALETAEYPELERWKKDILDLVSLAQSMDS
jgi:hypothetical protein